jgi:ankyrin repeat protein
MKILYVLVLNAIFAKIIVAAQFNETKTLELACKVDEFGSSLLTEATKTDFANTVQKLIESGANPNATGNKKSTSLFWAAWIGDGNLTEFLLRQGAVIEEAAKNRNPLLHVVVELNHLNVASKLIKWGAPIEDIDDSGNTPLIVAAVAGYDQIVNLLLNEGANVEAANFKGRTALYQACKNGYYKVVLLLLDFGAQLSLTEFQVAKANVWDFFQRLEFVEQGFPLHQAVRLWQVTDEKELTALIKTYDPEQLKADINQKDTAGITALDIATIACNEDAVLLLLNNGANPFAGLMNCLRRSHKIKYWQLPFAADISKRSQFEKIYDAAKSTYVCEIALCSPEMPQDVILIIIKWMLTPWVFNLSKVPK